MSATADFAAIAAALKVSLQAIQKRATKETWPFTEQPVRGGKKRLFPISTLPPDVRNALLVAAAAAHDDVSSGAGASPPAPLPAAAALPSAAAGSSLVDSRLRGNNDLTQGQRTAAVARERIVRFVAEFAGSAPAAIDWINGQASAGRLPAGLAWAYLHAWDKRRAGTRLNLSTLNKWKAVRARRGLYAPKKPASDMTVKPWYGLLLALLKRPQGGCLTWVVEQIEKQWQPAWGEAPPSYSAVRRARDKFSELDKLKGRYSGSQLRSHLHYKPRSAAGMAPWDEVHADGWNTHFTAPHPVTGEYVTYEVWHAHDVATRYVPPFSVGLTENAEVILKCIEHAVRAGGAMRHLQTDSTRIVKNSERFKTNPATSLEERLGITIVHPQTVGNSQANGIAENFNAWLDRECRELATYQNPKRMDELSFKRGQKLTTAIVRAANAADVPAMLAAKRELERANKGLVFMSFEEACAWLEARRQKWNDKPHRSLPKVRDGETGRLRHQSPREALFEAIANGWDAALPELPDALLEQHLQDTFRPHIQVKVVRGAVSPYGGMRYRHDLLDQWLGKPVVVAYDISDWRSVTVKTLKGEFICEAAFVESVGYRTLSAQEFAEEKRATARIRAKERAIARDLQRTPGLSLEGRETRTIELTPADFFPVVQPAKTEPEKTLIDFLPEKAAPEREATWEDTVMYLYGNNEGKEEGTPEESAAV